MRVAFPVAARRASIRCKNGSFSSPWRLKNHTYLEGYFQEQYTVFHQLKISKIRATTVDAESCGLQLHQRTLSATVECAAVKCRAKKYPISPARARPCREYSECERVSLCTAKTVYQQGSSQARSTALAVCRDGPITDLMVGESHVSHHTRLSSHRLAHR